MKMNKTNYFNSTYSKWECVEYKLNNVPDFISYKKDSWASEIEGKPIYTKKISSQYWYNESGVYRLSDHWGCVGSCVWLIEGEDNVNYEVLAYCKWEDFKKLQCVTIDDLNDSQVIKRPGFIYDCEFSEIQFIIDEYGFKSFRIPGTQVISGSINLISE